MNTVRTGWRRRVLAQCGAGVSFALAGFAAESSAPATAAAAGNAAPSEGITAARREFEAMKAVRDPAQQSKGALPKLAMPELQQGGAEPRPWASPKSAKSDPTGKKSANWLVDAMEKESRRSSERGGSRDGRAREETEDADENLTLEATKDGNDELSGASAERVTREREITAQRETREVVNPLTRFLGDWMTPGDYAILKPALDEAATGRAAGRPDLSPAAINVTDGSLSAATLGLPGATEPNRSTPAPRENPYLQALQAPPPAGPSIAPVFTPPAAHHVPVSPHPVMAPAAPVTTAPKSKIPEFAKPAQEEKYFKQLKRF